MKNIELSRTAQGLLFPNYKQYPVVITRGKDCRVWDAEGNEYLDFVAGIATCNLGHCHPAVVDAVVRQAGQLVHVSNWYYNEPQIQLASLLTGVTNTDRVFFCNSGAEANEAAIKLARKHAFDRFGPGRELIISLFGAFHGRTMKALTATDPKHHSEAFAPYPEGFIHIEPGDTDGLKKFLPKACALFMEPIQAEGGVRPIGTDFIAQAGKMSRENNVLLIMDEVQTGMGRCGAILATDLLDVDPDIVTLAKGLGNGFPIGAVLTTEKIAAHFGPGTHGSTFGGNPLACAAAIATINTLMEEDLPVQAASKGKFLLDGLRNLADRHSFVVDVRGTGLLLGLELDGPAAPLAEDMMKKGYLVTVVQERTLRFTPPLTISEEDMNSMLSALSDTLHNSGGNPA